MGRRLNVSTPTVINTELVPLDESFYLDVDGQMEQWYYDNTEQYAPNRKVTPLLLVPVISVFDKDTSTSYTPTFNTTQWFANEWNEAQGKYVETEITNYVDSGSADYVIQGNNLLVKKNVSYSHAVSIRCVATYIDPRDSGVTYAVEDSVNLTTNRTADVVFPEVDIISPSGRAYNPLVDDENSQYDFKGVTTNNPVQPLNTDVRRYPVDVNGTEEILNSGEAVAPIMDIRYGNNPTMANQEFMYRQTADGTLVGESIDKAYIERIKGNTIKWNNLATPIITWACSDGTITINGEKIIATWTSSYSNNGLYCPNGIVIPSGHYYYTSAIIKNLKSESRNIYLGAPYGSRISNTLDANQEKKISGIILSEGVVSGSTGNSFHISADTNIENSFEISDIDITNLTEIFGEGNEPTSVEDVEAYLAQLGNVNLPHSEGTITPVKMSGIKSVGFNQWDGTYGEGYISSSGGAITGDATVGYHSDYILVLPETNYYNTVANVNRTAFYDTNKNYISSSYYNAGSIITTPANCHYVMFDWGTAIDRNTICFNLSDPSKNGTYEPYEEKVQGFDVTAIKGKLNGAGESVTIFPDGLKKASNVQDEIFVEDGVVKAIKRVGSVDMGTLTYDVFNVEQGRLFRTTLINDLANVGAYVALNAINARYIIVPGDMRVEKTMSQTVQGRIDIIDSIYSDAAAFKAAMQGIMLYYELATPETYVLDPITDFVWYGIKNGQEVLADTLPWYVSGQGTDNLVVDAMYGENINVVLRCKMMDGETLSPSKAYATLSWRTPDIEPFVQSDNGGAVRSDTEDMTFGTIVNVNGDVLTDALKQKHLAFNWKIRKNNVSTETDKGWGQRITIDASDLRNVKGMGSTLASTLVNNVVYLKGAYEEVTDNGEIVTDNGEVVYDRPVD